MISYYPIFGKILFLGDSITDNGLYISYIQAYLDLHQPQNQLTLYNLGLSSETVSGLSEPEHPFPRPKLMDRLDRAMLTVSPQWVFLMYGINDGIYYPFSEERFAAYKDGMRAVVNRLKEYGVHIAVMTPTPFEADACPEPLQPEGMEVYGYGKPYAKYDEVMEIYTRFILEELAGDVDLVIDLRSPLYNQHVTKDGVHPSEKGHWLIAREILLHFFNITLQRFDRQIGETFLSMVYEKDTLMHVFYKEVVGHSLPDHPQIDTYEHTKMKAFGLKMRIAEYIRDHEEELTTSTDEWNGYRTEHFYYRGYEALIVHPHTPREGNPWVWRTEFFGAFPSVDLAMLKEGYAVLYIAICDQYGAPGSLPIMESFYHLVREKYGLSERMIPFGFSRGGLYAMLIAEAHPAWIGALYLDAPVVDIRSWPRRFKKEYEGWEQCLKAWEYTEESAMKDFDAVLKSRIETLVLAQIPLALVYGDADGVVPYEENGRLLERAYENSQAPHLFIGKKGCGHHPHSLEDPTPVVRFLVDNTQIQG